MSTPKADKSESRQHLAELIGLVQATAKAKGWTSEVSTRDDKNHRHATVGVSRWQDSQQISGAFEILCDDRVSIGGYKTSFYGYGFNELHKAIANEFHKLPWLEKKKSDDGPDDLDVVERLLRRFHRVARQLRIRHADRTGLVIMDEYDIQDILHAILRGLFDDVRAEEYTPSYAGASSRMDFLLKTERIAIETKLASPSLRDREVGEQLAIDIARYKAHPDCSRLVCFVYDPGGHLKNPSGLEADLTNLGSKPSVNVIVVSP